MLMIILTLFITQFFYVITVSGIYQKLLKIPLNLAQIKVVVVSSQGFMTGGGGPQRLHVNFKKW